MILECQNESVGSFNHFRNNVNEWIRPHNLQLYHIIDKKTGKDGVSNDDGE